MLSDAKYIYQPTRPFKFGHDCRLDMVEDDQALMENLLNINTVKKKECFLNVDFGTNLHESLFEQNDVVLWLSLDTAIRTIVNTQEERVKIIRIAVVKSTNNPEVVQALVEWIADPSKVAKTTTINYPYGIMP